MTKNCRPVMLDPDFIRMLKLESIRNNLTMAELSRRMAKKYKEKNNFFQKNQEDEWNFGF
jgi:hypothetical protein